MVPTDYTDPGRSRGRWKVLLGSEAQEAANRPTVLGRQESGDGGGGLRNAVKVLLTVIAVLVQEPVADDDVPGPVLRVDDDHSPRAYGDVVDVRERPVGPAQVVEADPAVLREGAEGRCHEPFTFGPGRPSPLLALRLLDLAPNLVVRAQPRRVLLLESRELASATGRLVLGAVARFHGSPLRG